MSGVRVHVRRLTVDDASLAAQTLAKVKGGIDLDDIVREADHLRAWLAEPRHVLIAATDGDRPVGFALGYLLDRVDGDAPMLFFYEVEVAEAHRRCGIGARLVEAMKRAARDRRVVKMWVQTDPDNEAARRLYERAGGLRADTPESIFTWTSETLDGCQR